MKSFVKLAGVTTRESNAKVNVDRCYAAVARHANAKLRSVTNQCDRLISEELRSSSHSPFAPYLFTRPTAPSFFLLPDRSSDRNPDRRVHSREGPDGFEAFNRPFRRQSGYYTEQKISKDSVLPDPRLRSIHAASSFYHEDRVIIFGCSRMLSSNTLDRI